jgi:hypothetical protein
LQLLAVEQPLSHLKPETLRVSSSDSSQPHLFVQPLLEARQHQIALTRTIANPAHDSLRLKLSLLADVR